MQKDIYLLEVIGGWTESNPDRELFETTFDPNGSLRTGFDRRLHLIITTPSEFKTALQEKWKSSEEIIFP